MLVPNYGELRDELATNLPQGPVLLDVVMDGEVECEETINRHRGCNEIQASNPELTMSRRTRERA